MAYFDVQELILEKPCSVLKSAEELERLTVDEQLKPIERAVFLLSSGQEVQRVSVVNSLPELLHDHQAECLRRIVPKIREVVRVAESEMQLAACEIFVDILQKKLISEASYASTFLQTIFMCIENKDTTIADAWLVSLLRVVDLLPKEIIAKEILGKAVAKGQLHQPVQSRLACCKMLGTIVTKFDPIVIKRDILPTVLSLCQDVDYEVRACMAHLLEPIARGLAPEDMKAAILPELDELSKDERSDVRLAALDAIVSIMGLFDNESLVLTIVPLATKYCQDALQRRNEDPTMVTVAQHYGQLYQGIHHCLGDEQRKYFIDFYKRLCRMGLVLKKPQPSSPPDRTDPRAKLPPIVAPQPPVVVDEFDQPIRIEEFDECRQRAAFNFPAMASLVNPKSFKTELAYSFDLLCNDPDHRVRATIAAGFHEVAKVLGNSASLIIPDLIQLLNDNSTQVLGSGYLTRLPIILDLMCRGAKAISSESKYDILSAIISCEAVIFSSNNWRLQEEYMTMLSCLPHCFSADLVYLKIVPLVFRKLARARALPVRRASARTLLLLIRANCHAEQRETMCTRLVEEFACGRSYHQRSLFIDVCAICLDIFSRAFFKQWFCEPLLKMHCDPVANMRLRVCGMLPRVKRTFKHPADKNLAIALENCIRARLANERDHDVEAMLKRAIGELYQIDLESMRPTEEDRDDQRRAEEERKLMEAEDREGRISNDTITKKPVVPVCALMKRGEELKGNSKTAPKTGSATKLGAMVTVTKNKSSPSARDMSPLASVTRSSGVPSLGAPNTSSGSMNNNNGAAKVVGGKKPVTSSLSSGSLSSKSPTVSLVSVRSAQNRVAPSGSPSPSPLPVEIKKSGVQRSTSFK